jgi:hypothetical protein
MNEGEASLRLFPVPFVSIEDQIERIRARYSISIDDDEALKDEIMFAPLEAGHRARIEYWRNATFEERVATLNALAEKALSKPGNLRDNERFPGFPKKKLSEQS